MAIFTRYNDAKLNLMNTIAAGVELYPTYTAHYFMNRVFNEAIVADGAKWRTLDAEDDKLSETLKKNLRKSGVERMKADHRAREIERTKDMPWGDEKCRALYGYGLETYLSM